MRLLDTETGDILEMPPPNENGESVLTLNGKIIERVLFSDENGGSVTLGDGRNFKAGVGFAEHVKSLLGSLGSEHHGGTKV